MTTRQKPAGGTTDNISTILRHNVRLDRIEYIRVDALNSYGRKLRRRVKGTIEALKASLQAFGIVSPILIDASNTIIGGEAIVEAARALGYVDVPTIRVEHLDEAEVRFLRLALNKLSENSRWDEVELAVEFTELIEMDTVLAYEVTGFSTPEIDNLLYPSSVESELDPDDDLSEVGKPGMAVSRIGDVWQLGRHRVLCGSSLDHGDLAILMDGQIASMVLTDHPYNLKIDGFVSGNGKNKNREFVQASGDLSEEQFTDFLSTSIAALAARCRDGALLYMFMDFRHQWEMMTGVRAAHLALLSMAVWVKASGGMGSFYRSQHELCYIAKKGKAPHTNNIQLGRFGRTRTTCWFYPGVNTFGAGRDELLAMHSTCKNVSMLADAIRDATNRGEVVLDGFLGSGSTLIAAERTDRVCRGVELDPLYVDTIVHRWEKATGQKAALIASGETFDQVEMRRAAEALPQVNAVNPRPRVRPVV